MSNKQHFRYKKNPEDGKTYAEIMQEDIKKHGMPKGLTSWGEDKLKQALRKSTKTI